MANALSQFNFQTNAVRTIAENGEIWFVAKDVLTALDYSESSNPAKVTQNIPEEWKGVKLIHTLGGNQKLLMISEQGLYFFLGRSDKPKALPFQKWLAGEVLPSIRKTGSYAIQSRTIDKIQQGELSTLIAERFPSGKDRPYAWSRFNNHFRLASYKDLPANRFGEACEYIKTMPELVPAIPANYNYPLESARPRRTIGRTAWMTVDVLLDECNPAPEMDLLAALEKAGYDVEGVRLRIESMHYQLEEYRKFRRRLKDLCEDVSVNRGRNVNFLPSGNVTARIAND